MYNTSLLSQDPTTLIIALIAGTIPSLIWLIYWIREDDVHREPLGLIILTFITGMIMVLFVLPIQKFIHGQFTDEKTLIILWASAEEILKYIAFALIALRSSHADEPIDYPIYCMTAALGFAALENTLFLINPIGIQDTTVTLLTTNLRFLGSTLLHSVATGFIGLMMGLAFFQNGFIKFGSLIIGFILAIGLHSVFNFFIMEEGGGNFLQVFAFLWVVSIISILVFEKVRRMSKSVYKKEIRVQNKQEIKTI
jgi:protease PrsW